MRARIFLAAVVLAACGGASRHATPTGARDPPPAPSAREDASRRDITITVLALNDLHGRLVALPVFAGYANNVRASRARDAGGALLLDAGDMFQGSLESNLDRGASVLEAYRALGMQAVALGNHEFDYGPIDLDATGDPQGTLKARVAEAGFPVLGANLVDASTQVRPAWPGLSASTIVEVAGVRIGIVGALTMQTPEIVMPAFFRGLGVTPIAPALEREAASLRARGAEVVVGVVHAGGDCERFDDPHDVSSCAADAEIFRVAEALPRGSVDAIVAGHTHAGVAHVVHGIPIVEAYARGRAFSRLDLVVDAERHVVERATPSPPSDLCPDLTSPQCAAGAYEGAPVVPDARVATAIAPALARAHDKRVEVLGPEATRTIERAHDRESPLGNLFADLVREAVPGADLALVNGGSLRANLPAGAITYGALYEAMPFDNRLARVTLPAAALVAVLARHLAGAGHGIVSLSGMSLRARCEGGVLRVALRRLDGRRVRPNEVLRVATSDYLATGGDRLFGPGDLAGDRVESDLGRTLRDAMADRLRERRVVDPRVLYDAKHPRLDLPARRPIRCP